MINKETAYNKINTVLLKMGNDIGLKLKINDDYFKNFSDFMLFPYNSEEYLINRNISYALAGNLPFVIDKNEGNIYNLIGFSEKLEDFKFKDLLDNGFLERSSYQ